MSFTEDNRKQKQPLLRETLEVKTVKHDGQDRTIVDIARPYKKTRQDKNR